MLQIFNSTARLRERILTDLLRDLDQMLAELAERDPESVTLDDLRDWYDVVNEAAQQISADLERIKLRK